MAVISHQVIANEVAYASASLNKDIAPPEGARAAIFYWNISAVAGTTPIADCKLQYKDPTSGQFIDIDGAAFGQKTAAAIQSLALNDEGSAADATGDFRQAVFPISSAMRAVFTLDRTSANETYTFTLSVDWLN